MQLSATLRLLRPQQWIKNCFVFLPMFFGGKIAIASNWGACLLAFASFCLVSSSIYCLNDLLDVKADRMHPVKCKRPIASRKVPVSAAWMLFALLALAGLGLPWLLPSGRWQSETVVALYFVLNLLYCFRLKHIAIVDVFIVSTGFVLRVILGGTATGIWISPWLVCMTFLLALFIAFAKRRDDVVMMVEGGRHTRRNVEQYNLPFVNQVLSILAAVTIVSYMMYTLSADVEARLGSRYVYVSTVFVLAGILRYLQLAVVCNRSGSPTKIVLHDRFLQACIILWLAAFALIIYF